ncbi:MAG: ferrous iron transporter B, partial [Bacteroidales bacterium]|nr:ferrous iron transporter B [Bacteroidales bacterium]
IGLHGKSFIPLLMGFGCNVPAILSTRIIESKRDRLITILINPFMSCSARLPVYVLLISAFFPSYQGTMLFLVYFIGVGIAVISAFILQKIVIKKADIPFVMELPPYRRPTTRSIVKHMWHRTEQYIKKITGIVLIASVIIWALNYFPKNEKLTSHYETRVAAISTMLDDTRPTEDGASTVPQVRKDTLSALLQKEKANYLTQRQKQSYIGRLGHFIQPVMAPLGFDWKMSVAILTGITAKEIIVGTLGVLYQAPVDEVDMPDNTLIEKLRNQQYESGPNKGEIVFTPLAAFTFMIFILIYFPCVAVVASIKKETGSWKWPLFSVFFNTSIAWIVSFLIYQIGSLTGL